MAETVLVSLLHPRRYRESKDAPWVEYRRGLVEMPLEHARALGVTHRIRNREEVQTVVDDSQPFGGTFNKRLADKLTQAGYKTLDDLSQASQSELMALGIGPANFERIQNAIAAHAGGGE